MRLIPISFLDQRTDIFIKTLSFKSFTFFLPKLGMLDIFQPQASRGYQKHLYKGKKLSQLQLVMDAKLELVIEVVIAVSVSYCT